MGFLGFSQLLREISTGMALTTSLRVFSPEPRGSGSTLGDDPQILCRTYRWRSPDRPTRSKRSLPATSTVTATPTSSSDTRDRIPPAASSSISAARGLTAFPTSS